MSSFFSLQRQVCFHAHDLRILSLFKVRCSLYIDVLGFSHCLMQLPCLGRCKRNFFQRVDDFIYRSAEQRIVLIDNFVDERVLTLLTKRADGVSATIHSRYTQQFMLDIEKHNEQYEPIEFVQIPHKSHDRFLIIDNDVYLMGASVTVMMLVK